VTQKNATHLMQIQFQEWHFLGHPGLVNLLQKAFFRLQKAFQEWHFLGTYGNLGNIGHSF